jgi:hypothetical protein
LTAALVIVVGIYISIYAWFEVQSYAGQVANNPVIDFALSIQTAIIQFVVGLLGAVNLL